MREAGIDFGVVPGVTAGVAAAAYAGIPVTHRGLSTAVALVTGHEDPARRTANSTGRRWRRSRGRSCSTWACASCERIASSLIDAGRPASEPAAVVERGTLPDQRTVTGTLATIAERGAARAGESARDHDRRGGGRAGEQLGLAARRPLAGRTVAVTRARAQASELARRLRRARRARSCRRRRSARRRCPGPPLDPAPYDLICLTSPNGVEFLFERLAAGGRDARALAGARDRGDRAGDGARAGWARDHRGRRARALRGRVACRGTGRRARCAVRSWRARARRATCCPTRCAHAAREVDVLALYETVAEPLSERARAQAREADYITFTSSSTVRFFLRAAQAGASADSRLPRAKRGSSRSGR